MDGENNPAQVRAELAAWRDRAERTGDEYRSQARSKRHARGYRTARENLADLVDEDSFLEYGQLAVAAQRNRRDYEELQSSTAADGVITGTCTINAASVSHDRASAAVRESSGSKSHVSNSSNFSGATFHTTNASRANSHACVWSGCVLLKRWLQFAFIGTGTSNTANRSP